MIYECATNKFLVKDKRKMDFDEFSDRFYRSLRLNNQKYEEEQFEDFLTELYMKTPEVYNEWHKLFFRIPYSFTMNNIVLMTNLVSNDNFEYATIAYEMFKKKKSLIVRCLPVRVNASTVSESKSDLFAELTMQLILTKGGYEDSLLKSIKDEFSLAYGEYEDNQYLGDLFNSIMDSFESEISNAITKEINKINHISSKLIDRDNIGLLVETQESVRKDKHTVKAYKKY